MDASDGFPPVARPDARILILGSLPGKKSIARQQYYAHSQNAFWPIIRELYGIDGHYLERCAQLEQHQLALWDVLRRSVRPGSLDSDICMDSAEANDFMQFFAQHVAIERVVFNGRKAEQMFGRFVDTQALPASVALTGLPSTSPAYAAMPFSGKLSAWKAALLTP